MSTITSTTPKEIEKHSPTLSQASTISSDGPPTPGPGFAGGPYRASPSSNKSKRKPEPPFKDIGFREVNYVSRLDVPNSTINTSKSSPISPMSHGPYTPSIYSPQTPAESPAPFNLGWTDGDEAEEEPVTLPTPLAVKKSTEKTAFDPECVPKPTYYELEKPYGGTKHFMMAHGLRYYNHEDCEIRKEILEQLKDLEWQNRVNTARDEYVRTGKVSEGLLPEVAVEYQREVEEVEA
ncbi:hypothetical protein Slin14017_G126670 [Septoria linicola]|nr:hypothetical protein Slin14017_G126670 [Septoria linicola]